MNNEKNATNQLFSERKKFLVLGLTGLTGSGCTTTANLLKSKTWTDFNPPSEASFFNQENDHRKYNILSDYLSNNWESFEAIRVKDIITGYIFENSYDDFRNYISSLDSINLDEFDKNIKQNFDDLLSYRNSFKFINIYKSEGLNSCNHRLEDINSDDINKNYEWYFEKIPKFSNKLKSHFNNNHNTTYTRFYQSLGDNIRSSGNVFKNDFSSENIFSIAFSTNKLIKFLRERQRKNNDSSCLVVIDTLRNPFEVFYFKERYSAFYLVAISTTNSELQKRLGVVFNYTPSEIKDVKKKEYDDIPSNFSFFITQNIKKCIEIADIYLNNPGTESDHYSELKQQLVWYLALMKHPGLVTPTGQERTMQLAYTAKLNSGCISRQVGAVITDEFFSIKAVGWNNTPEGQVPCILRKANYLLKGQDKNAFSDYEMDNKKFRNEIKDKLIKDDSEKVLKNLNGRHLSFCFKDVKNSLDGKGNQVHSRSLHAEENAFLQISKYGGQSLLNGFLFTTASPCELCSKKAYQLGIKEIYYIDPYPGIAEEHILKSGKNRPRLILFSGAIGVAYHSLYQPILPYKDELKMLLGYEWTDKTKDEINKLEQKIAELRKENEILKQKKQ